MRSIKISAVILATTVAISLGLTALPIKGSQTRGVIHDPGTTEDGGARTLDLLDAGFRLPIEITGIRNFHSKHWVRDLEIAIKNISDRRIYGIYVDLTLPEDTYHSGGLPLSFGLHYGRFKLIDIRERPTENDIPLEPGETALLRVDQPESGGYEAHLKSDQPPEKASHRVRMTVLTINFGDGTGFINGGSPHPGDPRAPRPQPRYIRMPVEPKPEQSMRFHIPALPIWPSTVPATLVLKVSARPFDVCCPSSCDGNYANVEVIGKCDGCDIPGIEHQPCWVSSCSDLHDSQKACLDPSTGNTSYCRFSQASSCAPPPGGSGGGLGGCLDDFDCAAGQTCLDGFCWDQIASLMVDSGSVNLTLTQPTASSTTLGSALTADPTEALLVYDQPKRGGNGDGLIDASDDVFPRLLVWIDDNHDGKMQRNELYTLASLGIASIALTRVPDRKLALASTSSSNVLLLVPSR